MNLGGVRFALGEHEEAVRLFNLGLQVSPNNVMLLYSLGSAYAAVGMREEAVRSFEMVMKLQPDFAVRPPGEAPLRRRLSCAAAAPRCAARASFLSLLRRLDGGGAPPPPAFRRRRRTSSACSSGTCGASPSGARPSPGARRHRVQSRAAAAVSLFPHGGSGSPSCMCPASHAAPPSDMFATVVPPGRSCASLSRGCSPRLGSSSTLR